MQMLFRPSSLVATLYNSLLTMRAACVRVCVCLGGHLHVYCCSWLAGARWHRCHHCRNDANQHIYKIRKVAGGAANF